MENELIQISERQFTWGLPEINISLIEEHLYLGSYNGAIKICLGDITEPNIKTIISIINDDSLSPQLESITYHQINALDFEAQDLLTYFAETNELIENCQKSGSNVLVHCMAGISRSATIVIAYIMYKHKMSFSSARDLVKSKRDIIDPNNGFVDQLKLFEKMGFCLDANDRQFRRHLIDCYLNQDYKDYIFDVNKYFEKLSIAENLTPELNLGQTYNCSKCNHKLFNQLHILSNEELTGGSDEESCHTVYVEPQDWMTELFNHNQTALFPLIQCINCSENKAKFHKLFQRFICNCPEHIGIDCLRIQMLDNSFKSAEPDIALDFKNLNLL